MTITRPTPAEVGRRKSRQFSAVIDRNGRIALAGELDITRLDALRAVLDEALGGPGSVLSVDVGELSFIDPAAVSELLRYQLFAATRQRRLWLNPVSDPVEMVLDLFDLHDILGPMSVVS